MKLRVTTSIILFLSSYTPLLLILIVKDFDFINIEFKNPIFITIFFITIILSIFLLRVVLMHIKKRNSNMPIKINHVSDRSQDLINYTVPYIISFYGFDLSKWSDNISLGIFIVLMCVLTIRSKMIFINPLLAVVGYGMYDIEYTYNETKYTTTVLTKLDLKEKETYQLRNVTKFLYLITE